MTTDNSNTEVKETRASNTILKAAGIVAALVVFIGVATNFLESLSPLKVAVVNLFSEYETAKKDSNLTSKEDEQEDKSDTIESKKTVQLKVGEKTTVFGDYTFELLQIKQGSSGPVAVLMASQTLESFYNSNEGTYPDSNDELTKTLEVSRKPLSLESSIDDNIAFGGEWHYISVIAENYIDLNSVELIFFYVWRAGG